LVIFSSNISLSQQALRVPLVEFRYNVGSGPSIIVLIEGFQESDSIDSALVQARGSYQYCPPSNNPNSCRLPSISSCAGTFCPPGVSPSGSTIYPLPAPQSCYFEFSSPRRKFRWLGRFSQWYAIFGPVQSTTAGCPPPTPENASRIGDLSISIQTVPVSSSNSALRVQRTVNIPGLLRDRSGICESSEICG